MLIWAAVAALVLLAAILALRIYGYDLACWVIERRGEMPVRAQDYAHAFVMLADLEERVAKSGALNEAWARRPKIVRKIDRTLTRARAKLESALPRVA